MRRRFFVAVAILASSAASSAAHAEQRRGRLDIPADVLADKIRGGLVGQLLGNLNGLAHEMKYIDQPGDVRQYTPALPEGARTDDDTDLEWVYVIAIQRDKEVLLPPERITALWKAHISDRIWCANRYARALMDLGIDPPLTGKIALNPWSEFNISGQFVCESFGLIAPGMPQTATRVGLHYTHVTIEGEPAQTTQLFTAMIATAFVTEDLDEILDTGVASIDPKSRIYQIVADVRRWHRDHPDDWRATRRLVKEKYSRHGGAMRDRNGYELNTAATIAALLYGRGDLVETLRIAFNFGWDADNNAATSGTIVGVIKGWRWMEKQGWQIAGRYRNTSRPGMPKDETISRFAARLADVAEQVILAQGGEKIGANGRPVYRIQLQKPANVEPLADPTAELERLRATLRPKIVKALETGAAGTEAARACYLAICLDVAKPLALRYPRAWSRAVAALQEQAGLLKVLRDSPTPDAEKLRKRMRAFGVRLP